MTTASLNSVSHGWRRLQSPLIIACGLAIGLGGCAKVPRTEITGSVPQDYRLVHPITLAERIEAIDIPVSVDTGHLTKAERGNVVGFAQRFMQSGSAVIAIVAPSGSPNQVVAAGISLEIEEVLRRSGIDRRAIDYRVYAAGPEETIAPVRVAFSRIAATTEPCGPWPDQVGKTSQNRNYHNFGCATQQNLAAMVANPLDLLYPRGLTPADAARRADVLEKYRKGTPYQSDYSREVGGKVAQGVGEQ